MTHLVHVLPGYYSMRYREVTSHVDTIDIFDSTNKYQAGIGIKHMPEFSWVNHKHVSQLALRETPQFICHAQNVGGAESMQLQYLIR